MNPPLAPPLPLPRPKQQRIAIQEENKNDTKQSLHGYNDTSESLKKIEDFWHPRWYFFYGTSRSESLLRKLLSLPEDLPCHLIPASLNDSDFCLAQWGCYFTLIQRTINSHVEARTLDDLDLTVPFSGHPLNDDNRSDADFGNIIHGTAYLVETAVHAQKLAMYETNAYALADYQINLHPDNSSLLDDAAMINVQHGADSKGSVNGKVFVHADSQPIVRKTASDIDSWQKTMGVAWPLKKRICSQKVTL